MTSHQLARMLLQGPDREVAFTAWDDYYGSTHEEIVEISFGEDEILLESEAGGVELGPITKAKHEEREVNAERVRQIMAKRRPPAQELYITNLSMPPLF